ncbi:hypothetical protein [uncultured Rubinisphaera sp.]|uniref:hypothetical protein n=1 Tax=uncultured Rubinisphaera sp. TaxID=1678686 RepID=UPI0030D8E8CA
MTSPVSARHSSRFLRGLISTFTYPRALLGNFRLPKLTYDTPKRRERGLTILLPGIEGQSSLSHSMVNGLTDGGVKVAIEIFDWTYNVKPAMFNLWMPNRNARLAASIAEKICDYQDQYPGRDVTLIGHSGGGAMIPKILEALPNGREIKRAVMIAPAISPRYDLSCALQSISDRIYHLRSPLDLYFLGFGTTAVGTLDRKYCPSAGNRGFKLPDETEAEKHRLYSDKFRQIDYSIKMLKDWHYGGHLSCMNRVFAEKHIAPLLTQVPTADVEQVVPENRILQEVATA